MNNTSVFSNFKHLHRFECSACIFFPVLSPQGMCANENHKSLTNNCSFLKLCLNKFRPLFPFSCYSAVTHWYFPQHVIFCATWLFHSSCSERCTLVKWFKNSYKEPCSTGICWKYLQYLHRRSTMNAVRLTGWM